MIKPVIAAAVLMLTLTGCGSNCAGGIGGCAPVVQTYAPCPSGMVWDQLTADCVAVRR